MLKIKRAFIVSISFLLLGCQPTKKGDQIPKLTTPQIVKSNLQSYAITDSLVVNSVVAILYNPGKSRNYQYIVELQQGDESWVDTIAYYAIENDTARHQVIFGESIFSKENPAAFNTYLKPVEKK